MLVPSRPARNKPFLNRPEAKRPENKWPPLVNQLQQHVASRHLVVIVLLQWWRFMHTGIANTIQFLRNKMRKVVKKVFCKYSKLPLASFACVVITISTSILEQATTSFVTCDKNSKSFCFVKKSATSHRLMVGISTVWKDRTIGERCFCHSPIKFIGVDPNHLVVVFPCSPFLFNKKMTKTMPLRCVPENYNTKKALLSTVALLSLCKDLDNVQSPLSSDDDELTMQVAQVSTGSLLLFSSLQKKRMPRAPADDLTVIRFHGGNATIL